MYSLTFSEFNHLSKTGNIIPLFREIPADLDTPLTALLKIRTGDHDFLLESVVGGEKWGRYSFLGTKPVALIRSKGLDVEIVRGKKIEKIRAKENPLEVLKNYMAQFKPVLDPRLPRFFGGAVGYMAYDMVRFFEKLPNTSRDELGLYDFYFLITDKAVLFDNLRQVIIVISNIHVEEGVSKKKLYQQGQKDIDALVKKLQKGPNVSPVKKGAARKVPSLKPTHSETEFCQLVDQIKKYIQEGDVFQTVISTRFQGNIKIPPVELYRAIRRINPSPYLYFLELGDMAIVGASPEVMVRLEDGRVELRPIAGTRKRGKDEAHEKRMEEELKNDPKEKAEHIMLVDLGRNDLGRVCKVGSVAVNEMEVVEKYSHVMHLVSHVSGELKKGCDAFDVIKATFPAGTLSGAPKVRAMEIIEQLEGKRRGVYGGCVGYISFSGNMDMAITIRTALLKKGKIYVQAGAGIVYNSIPQREYLECKNKAMGMIKALEEAQ